MDMRKFRKRHVRPSVTGNNGPETGIGHTIHRGQAYDRSRKVLPEIHVSSIAKFGSVRLRSDRPGEALRLLLQPVPPRREPPHG